MLKKKCSLDTRLDGSSDSVIATTSVVDATKSLNSERNEDDGIDLQKMQFMQNKLDYTNVPNEGHEAKVPHGSHKLSQFLELKLAPSCKKTR